MSRDDSPSEWVDRAELDPDAYASDLIDQADERGESL